MRQLCDKNGQKEYQVLFRYVVFGILTTGINLIVFRLCNDGIGLYYVWANVCAWLASVIFAFVTNKIIVFRSVRWEKSIWIKEAVEFIGIRLLSGFLDMALMYIAISILHFNEWCSKIVVNIMVIIINYMMSKSYVFRMRI